MSWSNWTDVMYFCTSRGYLIPFRLCSDPSDVALQRPQWKVILPTRNLELSPPPLTKNSPSTLMATKTHMCTYKFNLYVNHSFQNKDDHWLLKLMYKCIKMQTFSTTGSIRGMFEGFAWLPVFQSPILSCDGCSLNTRFQSFVHIWIFGL